MKKQHIRILVVVMSAALLGLLGFQWVWVKNAVSLREKQFRFHVHSAMNAVVERLQDREIYVAINSGCMFNNPIQPVLQIQNAPPPPPTSCKSPEPTCDPYNGGRPRRRGTENVFRLASDSIPPTEVIREELSTGRMVNGKWVEKKTIQTTVTQGDTQVVVLADPEDPTGQHYAQSLVLRMLQSTLPLSQRLDPKVVDTLLRQEFRRREIDDEFVYAVWQEDLLQNFLPDRVEDASPIDHDREYYKVPLFPHDFRPSNSYLELQFPYRKSTTLRAMGTVLPTSGVLIMVVMGCFGVALVAFRRQQKLNDLKTDFINNMTHELKTPISTISLALEVLSDPAMRSPERITQYTRVIGQENDRLKSHVDRVLQAAAMERGELKLEKQMIDLETLVEEQIDRIRLHVEGRGGHILWEPHATENQVLADQVHLGGVIFNLLDNANKYSPEKPEIHVLTRNVPGGVEVVVKDHGLGISDEAQRKVFDKFYRVPTGNVHNVKGFGIGLSYALSMAKAHGGDISLDSELGKGSTFTLYIPQKHLPT